MVPFRSLQIIEYSVHDSRILVINWHSSRGQPTMGLSKIPVFLGACMPMAAGRSLPRVFRRDTLFSVTAIAFRHLRIDRLKERNSCFARPLVNRQVQFAT